MGFVISGAVIAYQVVIFALVFGENKAIKKPGITTIAAVLWTLTRVFFPPLMILQLAVSAVAVGAGKSR